MICFNISDKLCRAIPVQLNVALDNFTAAPFIFIIMFLLTFFAVAAATVVIIVVAAHHDNFLFSLITSIFSAIKKVYSVIFIAFLNFVRLAAYFASLEK